MKWAVAIVMSNVKTFVWSRTIYTVQDGNYAISVLAGIWKRTIDGKYRSVLGCCHTCSDMCPFCLPDSTTICGTKGYAAPEIFLGKPYSGKEVDIYALGVVTHMTVGGYLPFKDGGVKVVFHPERWAQVSQVCKDFVKALLLFDPKDRLQSTDVMQHVWLSSK